MGNRFFICSAYTTGPSSGKIAKTITGFFNRIGNLLGGRGIVPGNVAEDIKIVSSCLVGPDDRPHLCIVFFCTFLASAMICRASAIT